MHALVIINVILFISVTSNIYIYIYIYICCDYYIIIILYFSRYHHFHNIILRIQIFDKHSMFSCVFTCTSTTSGERK